MLRPKEFINTGGVIFLIGVFLYGASILFDINGIINKISYNFIMPLGIIFALIGLLKLKKEQKADVKILNKEEIEIIEQNKFKYYIFFIISILITIFIAYWFEIRPQQITLDCWKEAARTEINVVDIWISDSSNTDMQMEKVFQECLERHGFKK